MKDQPIINSLLDDDFYKFTMGQFIWRHHRDVPVVYEFQNRTHNVRLADEIDVGELREQLAHVQSLTFTGDDIGYLYQQTHSDHVRGIFCNEFLGFLRGLRLPMPEVTTRDGDLEIRVSGPWSEAIYWETIILSIVNELRTQAFTRDKSSYNRMFMEASMRFATKIHALQGTSITFADFGTRRRFSREWQERIDEMLVSRFHQYQFLGTSNVANARKFKCKPIGTSAHELPMAIAAMAGDDDDRLADAPYQVMRDWRAMYGKDLSIGLPDTFGSKDFLRRLPVEMLREWNGFRQDSGEPEMFAEDLLNAYASVGIDPTEKAIIFSDGLDLPVMQRLEETYHGRIRPSFGWGTNLTFDFPGIKPVSIVMKLAEVNGRRTVKLSDNPAKAMGPAEEVARYKRVFHYDQTEHPMVECRV